MLLFLVFIIPIELAFAFGFSLEVEMINKAHKMGLLTTPYSFNENEAIEMTKAGADIIVAHMGLTTSGSIGAKTTVTLDESVIRVQAIADATHKINPDAIVLCHGGTTTVLPLFSKYLLLLHWTGLDWTRQNKLSGAIF